MILNLDNLQLCIIRNIVPSDFVTLQEKWTPFKVISIELGQWEMDIVTEKIRICTLYDCLFNFATWRMADYLIFVIFNQDAFLLENSNTKDKEFMSLWQLKWKQNDRNESISNSMFVGC